MLEHLCALLRSALNRSRAEETTLGEELDLIDAYLNIQQIRMGQRLGSCIEVPDELRVLRLPPMLLQPLVENAIVHGVEGHSAGGAVTVRASRQADQLTIEILDEPLGDDSIAPTTFSGTGHGATLGNLRARLQALFGDRASFHLTQRAGNGSCSTLRLPVHT